MTDFTARIRGPIDRRLWMGLARRYRYRGLSAAGVAAVVVSASLDLSGTWVDVSDRSYRVEIRHLGDLIDASFAGTSERSFVAEFVPSRGIYRGSINLFWEEAEWRARCGPSAGTTNGAVVAVGPRRETLTVTFRRTESADGTSCVPVPAETDRFTLVRYQP